jgi:hypothetical protein
MLPNKTYSIWIINPWRPKNAFEFDNLRKTIIKYYFKKYFGIDLQMQVIDLKLYIFYLFG